jgi:hypothetical protein
VYSGLKKQINMSKSKKAPKKLVALLQSKLTPIQLVALSTHIVNSMTGNTHFQNPQPALATIATQKDSLEAAFQASMTHLKGTADKTSVARKALALSLKTLSGYVEGIANLDQDNAENIIISAGMAVKRPSINRPKLFTVKPGKASGSVNLDSKAEKGAVYVYEMTTDPNTPASWANIYIGKTTRFLKTGLSSGQRYYFRVAVIIKGVQQPWSPTVNVVIA